MKTAIATLSAIALLGFGMAARAAEGPDKRPFAGMPGIELGTRLNVSSGSGDGIQAASETARETATTPQPPKERKVRIVYPLQR